MDVSPQIKTDDELYVLLREGNITEFNKRVAAGEACDLTNCDFRGIDLRNIAADGLDLSGAYFRSTDLRGVNLSGAQLGGASLHEARVAGVLFPDGISANEILMSVQLGTRLRNVA